MRTARTETNRTRSHEAIARLVRSRPVHTQEELAALLGRQGFAVTQATLSRDLAELGAVRAAGPDGPTYELREGSGAPQGARGAARLLRSLRENGSLVVVATEPGG